VSVPARAKHLGDPGRHRPGSDHGGADGLLRLACGRRHCARRNLAENLERALRMTGAQTHRGVDVRWRGEPLLRECARVVQQWCHQLLGKRHGLLLGGRLTCGVRAATIKTEIMIRVQAWLASSSRWR
jgi:hypothetical protein